MNSSLDIAIVDYGMGNLFSVYNACLMTGLSAKITSHPQDLRDAKAVILPGVGAFGDAMTALEKLNLAQEILYTAQSGKFLFGICLGLQLMMSESHEFGHRQGLNLFKGKVIRFETPKDESGKILKVPEVQWNHIMPPAKATESLWANTLLDGTKVGEYMYFVHSFYCVPASDKEILTTSRYGDITYASTVGRDNIFACQYHPERSGSAGLQFYKNLGLLIKKN